MQPFQLALIFSTKGVIEYIETLSFDIRCYKNKNEKIQLAGYAIRWKSFYPAKKENNNLEDLLDVTYAKQRENVYCKYFDAATRELFEV